MLYGFGMMYQILDKYLENDVEEAEHAFIYEFQWPDSCVIKINEACWDELQRAYDILITEEARERIATVEDLKRTISDYSM